MTGIDIAHVRRAAVARVSALSLAALAAASVLLASGSARAGVADPVPLIGGTVRAMHVFSVTGVTATAEIGTVIVCTSLEKTKEVQMAVEVFNEEPANLVNDIDNTSDGVPLPMLPGDTRTIEISRDSDVLFTTASAVVAPPSDLNHASARVVATSSKIMCNAFLADDDTSPPNFVVELPMVVKTKQKGD